MFILMVMNRSLFLLTYAFAAVNYGNCISTTGVTELISDNAYVFNFTQ